MRERKLLLLIMQLTVYLPKPKMANKGTLIQILSFQKLVLMTMMHTITSHILHGKVTVKVNPLYEQCKYCMVLRFTFWFKQKQ